VQQFGSLVGQSLPSRHVTMPHGASAQRFSVPKLQQKSPAAQSSAPSHDATVPTQPWSVPATHVGAFVKSTQHF
jgi:hypothetical protein